MTNWEISPFITIFKRDQDSLNFVVELCFDLIFRFLSRTLFLWAML